MGRDPQEAKNAKRDRGKPDPKVPDFWSFHPTEADKKALESFISDGNDLDNLLEETGRLGVVLTVTRAKTGDSSCVVARNRFDGYGEGQALSVFNASPMRALWGMMYVLTVLHPHWPAKPVTTIQQAMDW